MDFCIKNLGTFIQAELPTSFSMPILQDFNPCQTSSVSPCRPQSAIDKQESDAATAFPL